MISFNFLLTHMELFSTILQVLKVLLTAVSSTRFRGTFNKIVFSAFVFPRR